MPRIKAQNRGSTVHYDTIPIGHIWIDPFVATKSNQFWGKKPDTTIPMYFIGWFFILKTDYRKWILVWWISNNWNKYQISPLITVSLDNGRKVSMKVTFESKNKFKVRQRYSSVPIITMYITKIPIRKAFG